ncbi:hypothetical protein ACPUVO_04425 [Pseudocolwellia sp. HL-MZ19]|uniref:hypothetical protein n=1 Tax=Pseudocolwellia sp. HL-MZ19 TaxID=3400846 RepID=UPI003CF9EFDA
MSLYPKILIPLLTLMCSFNALSAEEKDLSEHQEWLKSKFAEQHKQLIPIVAVADILFACNKVNDQGYGGYSLDILITKMDKAQLAGKLSSCLGDESVSSERAINYGLLGCFSDQLNDLPANEKSERMTLVKKAINSLSLEEKKKSFTQCVTDQSISYLQ